MSYVNRAKDSEASTNLSAIFTDETAFNATNSVYISAGTSSAPKTTLAATAVSATHSFYGKTNTAGGGTYSVDLPPYSCSSSALSSNGGNTITAGAPTPYGAGAAKGGFADLGFLPVGTLYFYYAVETQSAANTAIPASVSPAAFTAGVNAACGGGYTVFAGTNFTGTNFQVYALNDYSSTPILISGAAY